MLGMDISPQAIASASFPVVKKGFDPDHVRSFLSEVGRALESAQNQSTAMEARARAAVAKLQELTQATAQAPVESATTISSDDADAISRTLLLAQKAADATIAEARQEADTMVSAARAEAATVLAEARRQAAAHVEDARAEARRSSEAEKQKVESEVQALLARREFLVSDVDHLDDFVATQRRRVQDVAALLTEVAERGPGGLGDMRRPLLSAAADGSAVSTASVTATPVTAAAEPATSSADVWREQDTVAAVEVVTEPAAAPDVVLSAATDSETPAAAVDITAETPTPQSDLAAFSDAFGTSSSTSESDRAEGVSLFDDAADDAAGGGDVVDTEPTPTQSPALLDFDDLDATSEIPVVSPDPSQRDDA
jgi:cell division septum initiation protein DivIVA